MLSEQMQQIELFAIPSPCRGICETNAKGYCKGCLRSRSERLHWLSFSDSEKQYVLHLCLLRRRKLQLMAIRPEPEQQDNIFAPQQMDLGL